MLTAVVVGSGILAQDVAAGNTALALFGNTFATGTALAVLTLVLAPASGAHFNPAVTFALALRRELSSQTAAAYVIVQIFGALVGVLLAHAMFSQELLQMSTQTRASGGALIAEAVAALGLTLTVLVCYRSRPDAIPWATALFVAAAYWFTPAMSLANPAVALARAFTDSFSGIAPIDVPGFVLAHLSGAFVAFALARWLYKT
jgi:glycerol uptake facilitator-like aquaporin